MNKEIRTVDEERGIMRVTTVDERWYARTIADPETGLPVWDYVPSVTWICNSYPKGIAFYKWLAEKGWDESQAIKNAAGEKGSKVHLAVKALLDGETVKMESEFFNESLGRPEQLSLEEYDCIMSFCDWYAEAKPAIIATEFVVWNEEYRYAGMVDLTCVVSNDYAKKEKLSGVNFIIDLKTGQHIWPSHELQVSAYSHSDSLIANKPNTAILQLGYRKNKKRFKFTEVPDKFPLFLAARTIWENECSGDKPLQRDYPLSLTLGRTV